MFSSAGHALLYVPEHVLHVEDEGERACAAAACCYSCAFVSDLLAILTMRRFRVKPEIGFWFPRYSCLYPCIIIGYDCCGYEAPFADTAVEVPHETHAFPFNAHTHTQRVQDPRLSRGAISTMRL